MVKAILHGACGRMGHIIADIVSRDPEIEIIAGVDAFGSAYAGFPVYASLDECREEADVVIDFSTASAIDGLLAYSAEHAVPVVVCTTGLSEEQTANLKKTADLLLSLSPLTFTHDHARVLFAEQLYRVQMVMQNHPYHHR